MAIVVLYFNMTAVIYILFIFVFVTITNINGETGTYTLITCFI
jgi:hypothetical protein